MRCFINFICTGCALFALPAAVAQTVEDADLAQVYGGKDMVSIATGSRQSLARAPAATTVITALDIQEIGATDIDQVLETVPGLHVAYSPIAYNPIYIIRGFYSQYNPQVLMLINGIPITDAYFGDRSLAWGGMPVSNIARVEVIRGPSSALHGADAFAGVINIVTKTAADIDGTQLGARASSFKGKDAWVLHGGNVNGWEQALSLEVFSTNGQKQTIQSDSQSYYDTLFGTSASLTPGAVNTQRDGLDARLDLSRGQWRWRMGYQGRRNAGVGAGVAQALDPGGVFESDRINADLTYTDPKFSDRWSLTTQFSYFDSRLKSNLVLFPPGAFNGAFPQGMIGNPGRAERHLRVDSSAVYTGWSGHRLRLGTGYQYTDLYKIYESKNFDANLAPLPGTPPPVRDVSQDPTQVYILPQNRAVYYGYVQDEWAFAPDWNLTAGGRLDRYADFGSTFNPRLALVWQTSYRLTSKLLYGRAFRAPSFAELYSINNPVSLGNPNLRPETIDTVELAWDYRVSHSLQTGLTLFSYQAKDIIQFTADPAPATTTTAANVGQQSGHGLELTASWAPASNWRLNSNYAWQQNTDETTGQGAGYAPEHQAYLRGEWSLMPEWSLGAQAKYIGVRQRAAGDPRSALNGYTLVDLTVRRKRINDDWGLAFSVRNLFNSDAREPSPSPGLIVNDLPLPGRNYYLEFHYRL